MTCPVPVSLVWLQSLPEGTDLWQPIGNEEKCNERHQSGWWSWIFYSLDKQHLQFHLNIHILHEFLTAAGPTGTAFWSTAGRAAAQGGLSPQSRMLTQIPIREVVRPANPSLLSATFQQLEHQHCNTNCPSKKLWKAVLQLCPQRAEALIPFYLLVITS